MDNADCAQLAIEFQSVADANSMLLFRGEEAELLVDHILQDGLCRWLWILRTIHTYVARLQCASRDVCERKAIHFEF